MICPICEQGILKRWYCSNCNSYFWIDGRGLMNSGNILEMHEALLDADCRKVDKEIPHV